MRPRVSSELPVGLSPPSTMSIDDADRPLRHVGVGVVTSDLRAQPDTADAIGYAGAVAGVRRLRAFGADGREIG
jgi:hypothetical protein